MVRYGTDQGLMQDVIPEMRIANDSRELLNLCCVEFVKHVSREAQNISATDQRKTIYHEHVRKGEEDIFKGNLSGLQHGSYKRRSMSI